MSYAIHILIYLRKGLTFHIISSMHAIASSALLCPPIILKKWNKLQRDSEVDEGYRDIKYRLSECAFENDQVSVSLNLSCREVLANAERRCWYQSPCRESTEKSISKLISSREINN
jgi:hypothetical protein